MGISQSHATVFGHEISKALDRVNALQAVGRPHALDILAADKYVDALRRADASLREARELIEQTAGHLPTKAPTPHAAADSEDPFG